MLTYRRWRIVFPLVVALGVGFSHQAWACGEGAAISEGTPVAMIKLQQVGPFPEKTVISEIMRDRKSWWDYIKDFLQEAVSAVSPVPPRIVDVGVAIKEVQFYTAKQLRQDIESNYVYELEDFTLQFVINHIQQKHKLFTDEVIEAVLRDVAEEKGIPIRE